MKSSNSINVEELTYDELVRIDGGDPFTHDIGYAIGKVVGWIKNAFENNPSDNTWMVDVPPLTLFG